MVEVAPGIVAVECIGIVLYLIPLVLSIRWLFLKYNELRTPRRIFYCLIIAFSMVREIHISLNFSRAEGAPPFNEPKYGVRNNNMIIWTAVFGVYMLYSALMILIYEWASLLTKSKLESHKRLNVIVIVVLVVFNLEYWALLTAHVKSSVSMEATAYASIGCASIATLIPAVVYYFKIVKTLKRSNSYFTEKHKEIIRKLGIVIVPISLGLVLRTGIAWAVAVKGNTFLNFYLWITLFWMLPELIPVTIMLVTINQSAKQRSTNGVQVAEMKNTPSTSHLQESTGGSNGKTSSDSSGAIV